MDDTPQQGCEVLVIGAGPTGLMAAYLLHRAGIHVRIVDKNNAAVKESRAAVMTPRSLELFASLGLDGKLGERGIITTEIDFFVSGTMVKYDKARVPDTPFQFILMIPQSATEEVLIDALAEAGLDVERDVEVVGFEQGDDGVRISARHGDDTVSVSADFVIGADGAHSIVRKTLNLGFTGAKYLQDFLLGDIEVDWELDRERFRIFVHSERIAVFLPLYGQRSRVMTTDVTSAGPSEGIIGTEPLELAELEKTFAEVVCLPVKLRDPDWLTHFRTHQPDGRSVSRWTYVRRGGCSANTFARRRAGYEHRIAGRRQSCVETRRRAARRRASLPSRHV